MPFRWRIKTVNDIGLFHLGSKDEPDSCLLDKCGRGTGDNGELGLLVVQSSENCVGDIVEDGEDRREMYGGGRGFG
jgi:hypothetical protein